MRTAGLNTLNQKLTYLIFQGSDHCPVYVVLKPVVSILNQDTGKEADTHLLDISNPPGMYVDGTEQPSFRASMAYQLPKLSGKLMPEFSARRSIKEMFSKKTPRRLTGNTPPVGDSKIFKSDYEGIPTSPQAGFCTPVSIELGSTELKNATAASGGGVTKRASSITSELVSKVSTPLEKRQKLSGSAKGNSKGLGQQKQSKLSGFYNLNDAAKLRENDNRDINETKIGKDLSSTTLLTKSCAGDGTGSSASLSVEEIINQPDYTISSADRGVGVDISDEGLCLPRFQAVNSKLCSLCSLCSYAIALQVDITRKSPLIGQFQIY